MLVSNFSPQIDVTVIPSVFSRKFEVSIKGLPPNEAMEYWFFEPDGDNIGTGEVNSDSHGEYVDKEGNHVISYRETCSQPIKKGIYHFGVNRIKYKKNAKVRMSLGIWNGLPGEKKLVDFRVEYNKHPLLTLDVEKKVPWGMKAKVSGQLWLREEPFPWCSGAIDYKDRKIILNGNDINYTDVLTDGFSKFSREVQVGNSPRSDCFVQAHYDGDPIFFEKCDSEVIAYEIVKHQSILSLGIESLAPTLGNPTDLGLKAGRFYLLKGQLHDTTLDASISDRIIKFVGPVEFHLSSAVTDAEGCYTICIKIPDSSGTYSIVGTFDGDELYDGSTARLSLEIKPNSSPKISAFKEFKAFDSFKNGFEDYKELPQIRYSIWLLSILEANPIALGILDKNRDGEQITENGV